MLNFQIEILARLLLAALLGGVIGAERERNNRGAGLRTHALVSTASALIMIVSVYGFMQVLSVGRIVLDPSRVAAQVVSGVGFLGAGIIIFRRNAVRGLTTAASVWAVAAIGLAAGAGLYTAAVGATVILSFILTALKKLEKKFFPQRKISRLTIEIANAPGSVNRVTEKLKSNGLKILNVTVKHSPGQQRSTLKAETAGQDESFAHVLEQLQSLPGVESVAYAGSALPINDAEDFEDEQAIGS